MKELCIEKQQKSNDFNKHCFNIYTNINLYLFRIFLSIIEFYIHLKIMGLTYKKHR